MTDDLVERARNHTANHPECMMLVDELADEIERLRAVIREAREEAE